MGGFSKDVQYEVDCVFILLVLWMLDYVVCVFIEYYDKMDVEMKCIILLK